MKNKLKNIIVCMLLLCIMTACQTTTEEVITNPEQVTMNQLMEEAENHFKGAAYQESITKAQEMLTIDKQHTAAHLLIARSYMKQDEINKTKETLDILEKSDTKEVTAQYYEVHAEYQTKTRKYTEVLQHIDKAIQLETSNRRLELKGSIQYYLHQHQEAKTALTKAIKDKTDTERNTYYYLLTELAIYEQDYPLALQYIETLQTTTPDDSKIYAMQGYIYYLQSDGAQGTEQKQKLKEQGNTAYSKQKRSLPSNLMLLRLIILDSVPV